MSPMIAHIKMARESDADALAAIYRPFVENAVVSFEVVPPTPEEVARRIVEAIASYPWLVCEVDDRIVGYAYATRHRVRAAYQWSVDTSVYIDEAFWRCGMGRGLYTSLFGILKAQGFFNAFAGITLPNAGSVTLHEAMGFKPIGVYKRVGFKFGSWHDVGWWQLALNEGHVAPTEPVDVATVQQSSEWSSLLTAGESSIRP